MASNVLSKLLPPANGEPSIYETLREHEDRSDLMSSAEGNPLSNKGSPVDRFRDEEANVEEWVGGGGIGHPQKRSKGLFDFSQRPPRIHEDDPLSKTPRGGDDADDEVPQSLLVEDDTTRTRNVRQAPHADLPLPVPGPSNIDSRAKWKTTQLRQKLHQEEVGPAFRNRATMHKSTQFRHLDPKEQATWMWANVENLDRFLGDVYEYYLGHGIRSILLSRCLRLLTLAFIVAFSTFLTSCIDYTSVPESKKMSQIVVPRCSRRLSVSTNILLWLFVFFWIFKVFDYCRDIRRLRSMQNFYRHLLEIPDSDMQTISWQEVVKRLMNLRDLNPATATGLKEQHQHFVGSQSKQRMDAHDIANRLMRRDNYLIALINKDLLDFSLPVPFLRNRQLFSRTLEWNLQYCILDFVFNEQGQVRSLFLKDSHRKGLSDGFRSRFLFAGFISLVCAPFAVLYYMLFFFFRYFTEYQRNPSRIGSRNYTPFALWKFREFNELQHLFERRINMSYPFASRYTDQFPKDKTIQVSGFIAFVAGALASVLAVASLIDPESFLSFELTPERTVLFYLGVFGSIWAVARGNMPEENLVFDPEYALGNVTEYTHYMPTHWKGRLHTNEVRNEFAQLYRMKLFIFLEEITSIILAPYILWFSLPKSSDRLVDFFREFTVHVDGMGYLCSFAVFDFKKGDGNTPQLDSAAARDLREEYYSTKDGKMLASYFGFIDNYVTNQRPGAPYLHPANKASFHAPPTFPGLVSTASHGQPSLNMNKTTNVDYQGQSRTQETQGTADGFHSVNRRVSHNPAGGGPNTSISSILLDPHHQPSFSSMNRAKKFGHQSRLRASRTPLDHPLEDDEDGSAHRKPDIWEERSEGLMNENELGESWKMTQAGTRTEDGDTSEDEAQEDATPGVLGLVYQFSKAQSEGRPHVSI